MNKPDTTEDDHEFPQKILARARELIRNGDLEPRDLEVEQELSIEDFSETDTGYWIPCWIFIRTTSEDDG